MGLEAGCVELWRDGEPGLVVRTAQAVAWYNLADGSAAWPSHRYCGGLTIANWMFLFPHTVVGDFGAAAAV